MKLKFILIVLFIGGVVATLCFVMRKDENSDDILGMNNDLITKKEIYKKNSEIAELEKSILKEDFSREYILEETGKMSSSTNPDWWVNSGAFLYSENGVGRTIFGKLKKDSKWQKRFAKGKNDIPSETDGGYYPQNIFRLVTKGKWKNFEQEVYYNIRKYNLSEDEHRSASNALLLFNRYQDGFNLYYTGLRVDGTVVVKKKYQKKYYTIGQKKVLEGIYDRKNNPNLIPENKWIGVRSRVETLEGDKVEIKVFVNFDRVANNWQEVLSVVDDGEKYGGAAILESGYAGIRTDFMDVEFDDYLIDSLCKKGVENLFEKASTK